MRSNSQRTVLDFRPGQRSARRSETMPNRMSDEGYVYVIDMDLEKFFDTVSQSKLIEVLSRTIKDGQSHIADT